MRRRWRPDTTRKSSHGGRCNAACSPHRRSMPSCRGDAHGTLLLRRCREPPSASRMTCPVRFGTNSRVRNTGKASLHAMTAAANLSMLSPGGHPCADVHSGVCSSSAAESAEEGGSGKPASLQAGESAAGPWQDDREDTEPFDPTEVVWAPTPQIRQQMLNMRKRVCCALPTDTVLLCLPGCTTGSSNMPTLYHRGRHHASVPRC